MPGSFLHESWSDINLDQQPSHDRIDSGDLKDFGLFFSPRKDIPAPWIFAAGFYLVGAEIAPI